MSNSQKQKPWFRYVPLTDKEISTADKVLYVIYIVAAFFIPLTALISLAVLHFARKKKVHENYVKASSFAIIVIAILVVAIYFILKWGGGWRTLTSSPQTWVNQLIRTIEGWFYR